MDKADRIRSISELEDERYKLEKQIIAKKIEFILEIAKSGEIIPYQLELNEDEMRLLEDILRDKEIEDNFGRKKQ